ncbi:hypothetical protein FRC10_003856 [Ceratobasidium sp. 414]|nr:hypothetical protein FRC10_003856 [Ceratobasidium sp. 414]
MWDDTTGGDVWLVEPAVETGSFASDFISSSDTDSTADTTATIQSTEVHTFFRVEYGRAFPAYEGIPMVLPADDGEIRRLRIQHLALKLVAGEALDEIILAHLSSDPGGGQKKVLDVRTQTGMWAEETAVKFRGVHVKSIDVVPTTPHVPHVNLHYEFQPQVKDWRSLLKDMHRVLRPGGLFVCGEIYPQLTLPGERVPALEGPASRSARFFEDTRTILSKRGVLLEGSHDIDAWLSPDDELWGLQPTSGFRNIVHRVWEMPINSLWHPDPVMQEVGLLMAMNVHQFVESTRPVFLSSGLTDSEFDKWMDEIRREIRDPMNNAIIRYHLIYAYKL